MGSRPGRINECVAVFIVSVYYYIIRVLNHMEVFKMAQFTEKAIREAFADVSEARGKKSFCGIRRGKGQ